MAFTRTLLRGFFLASLFLTPFVTSPILAAGTSDSIKIKKTAPVNYTYGGYGQHYYYRPYYYYYPYRPYYYRHYVYPYQSWY